LHLEELLLQQTAPDAIKSITQDSHTLFRCTGKAPGLAGIFGRIAYGRKLLKDEADEPRSEIVQRKA
jgi:hypothetical protein